MKNKSKRKDASSPLSTTATQLQIKLNAIPQIAKNKQQVAKMKQSTAALLTVGAKALLNANNPLVIEAAKDNPRIQEIAVDASKKIQTIKQTFDVAITQQDKMEKSLDEVDINFSLIQCTEAYMAIATDYQQDVLPLITEFQELVVPILKGENKDA
jgi:hypothetical protein